MQVGLTCDQLLKFQKLKTVIAVIQNTLICLYILKSTETGCCLVDLRFCCNLSFIFKHILMYVVFKCFHTCCKCVKHFRIYHPNLCVNWKLQNELFFVSDK